MSKRPVLTHYSDKLTIGDTITHAPIQFLCKSKGNDYMGFSIVAILTEFLSLVKNSLKSEEVPLYADKIMSFCPTWSITDLMLCLNNGINGKYGSTDFPWKWNPDFIEWVRRYNEDKDKFFGKRHEKLKAEGVIRDAEMISLFPKELFANFGKVQFADKVKEKMLEEKIPDDVVAQGVPAIDAYIEKIRDKINKQLKP